ncbi:MAG TPA: TIGR03617 family F420-dependent LLM class oxidoreductase [Nocardioidaceae bacterium]|nr:TIGR03617 family F420-dependent LLM class oxidoreductase [Nocardioidaceae bacterium]
MTPMTPMAPMTQRPLLVDLAFHDSPPAIRESACAAERAGAAGLFVSEAQHDPFVSLTAAAATTERLTLGTSVAIAFARTPMSLAYAAHDLQQLSNGRLVLGLGTQVAAHVTRRYGMPWSRPAARMKEYVAALRAIWDSWQNGSKLDFQGDFYTHTLMAPAFSPGPLEVPHPRIWLAAVGPRMVDVAAEVADGLVLHPLTSTSYRDEVVLPAVSQRRASLGLSSPFDLSAMVMVACGETPEAIAEATAVTRTQIAFYASTPAYLAVLQHHGWEDLHHEAHAVVARKGFFELAALVDDDVLHTFAAVGTPDEVADQLRQRHEGAVDRITLTMPFQHVGPGSPALHVIESLTQQGARR